MIKNWNCRVMFFPDGKPDPYYAIHEVYYDENGKPTAYSEGEAVAIWEDHADLGRLVVLRMLEAFDKPVLTPADIGQKPAPELNQCDGCMHHAPIDEHGNHIGLNGKAFMSCQRRKYGHD